MTRLSPLALVAALLATCGTVMFASPSQAANSVRFLSNTQAAGSHVAPGEADSANSMQSASR
jgi:hypothetical protein